MFRYVTGVKTYERGVIHSSVATDTGLATRSSRVIHRSGLAAGDSPATTAGWVPAVAWPPASSRVIHSSPGARSLDDTAPAPIPLKSKKASTWYRSS